MLQLLNRSLASQCLSTEEKDERPREADVPALNETMVASAAVKVKKLSSKRRINKKTSFLPPTAQKQVKQHTNGVRTNQTPQCVTQPENTQRACSQKPPVSLLGPVPSMEINFPPPPFTGPFTFPPPPLGVRAFNPFVPPPPFGPSMPLAWQQGNRPSRMQFDPRCAPHPHPRTSSPLPMQRRMMRPPTNQQEADYMRWRMQLEEGGRTGGRPVLGTSNMDNQSTVNENGYTNQAPLAVPAGLPMQCDTMVIPVGFLPNGCYGPILQGAVCYPSAMYMRDVIAAPVPGPFLNHPHRETVV